MEGQMVNGLKIKVLTAIALMMMLAGISQVFAQTQSVYRIQSLFLYNFTKHVKWEIHREHLQ